MLPTVRRNQGYGFLYQKEPTTRAEDDTLEVRGKRYNLAELGEYVLVGRRQPGAQYWHVFTGGEEYLRSIVSYSADSLGAQEALRQIRTVLSVHA